MVLTIGIGVLLFATSCTSLNQTMREPVAAVKFTKSDFSLSNQVSAEAKTVKIVGIDWSRLFSKKPGDIDDRSKSINAADIPVIGEFIGERTKNYALYNLMNENNGYDVFFIPSMKPKFKNHF